MRITHSTILLMICLAFVAPWNEVSQAASAGRKPVELFSTWNQIRNAIVSNDGNWFAYWETRTRGDFRSTDAVIKRTTDEKELRFPIALPANADVFRLAPISFSPDSKWAAFNKGLVPSGENPSSENKRDASRVLLIDLLTTATIEFEDIKRFEFSGLRSKYVAFHKHPVENRQGAKNTESSDLILRELATSTERIIANVSEFAFDNSGRWLVWVVRAPGKNGNGVYLLNTSTGDVSGLDTDGAIYTNISWTEDGNALALIKELTETSSEQSRAVIGFAHLSAKQPTRVVYDSSRDREFPAGMMISGGRKPRWMDDLSGIFFDITKETTGLGHNNNKLNQPERIGNAENGMVTDVTMMRSDVVLWHWRAKNLQSELGGGKSPENVTNYLSTYRIREKKFLRLADETLLNVEVSPKSQWAVGLDTREYDRTNSFWRSSADLYVINLMTGERRLAIRGLLDFDRDGFYKPSPDWRSLLYFDDGQFFVYDMETGRARNITRDVPTSFGDTERYRVKRPFSYRNHWVWTKDGQNIWLPDAWDIWSIPIRGGTASNLTVNGKKNRIRYRIIRPVYGSFDQGINPDEPIYLSLLSDRDKKEGFARLEPGKLGPQVLLWDDAHFAPWSFQKARFADRFFFVRETFRDYPDYYVSDGLFRSIRRLTEGNPDRKNLLWPSGYRIIHYTSTKGDKLQASLLLPANYQPGRKYPTIVHIYAKQSNKINEFSVSNEIAFDPVAYASNGYAVLMPDIAYAMNDPGMSVVWSVVPAVNAAISTGIVDRTRLGIYGHSFGGYETEFLITQTHMFTAAVVGAGFSNLVSAYNSLWGSDPQSGRAQQDYFEVDQGRLGPLWENLDAYSRNSPVYHAPKVKTPLLIWHNDADTAVDFKQSIEFFNALRRLGKPAIMLQYKGEGHTFLRAKNANARDCTIRIYGFFQHYLMDKPAPKWIGQGVLR